MFQNADFDKPLHELHLEDKDQGFAKQHEQSKTAQAIMKLPIQKTSTKLMEKRNVEYCFVVEIFFWFRFLELFSSFHTKTMFTENFKHKI